MDQMPGPAEPFQETPAIHGGRFEGSFVVEATNESEVHLAMPAQEVDCLLPGPSGDDDRRESLTLAGRPDIDAAMVLALRTTMVSDQGSQDPAETTRDRDQLTLLGVSGTESASACGSPVHAGRPDIDAAMLLALRSASLTKNGFPMPDHLDPGQNAIGTPEPPGEC
jgi:hypothetical protein